MKMNFKTNRKAFTLVELLIVIAIIGILFVVLVSKVDFATDKASTTGVQTDFRSFQVAFETVSREHAGFNSLGWDLGDKADTTLITGYTYENADKDGGDRIRNSYDKGDMNLNGICEDGETWTGQKIYTETWTGIYTLDNPADATDMSAYLALEKAINKNLDPALQISIDPENKTIYMANGYQDPWKTEYHGVYLSNAGIDGMDRGAIVMYSDGPNKVFGSEQTIAKGKVTVTVKNGGINGQDDLSLVTCYTYYNGYGEVTTITEGFSNNQMLSGNGNGAGVDGYIMLTKPSAPIKNQNNAVVIRSSAPFDKFDSVKLNGEVVDGSNYTVTEGPTIVTFKPEYIASLPNGTHNFEIVSTDGSANCAVEFAVTAVLYGDANGNGLLEFTDVDAIFAYIYNPVLNPVNFVAADVNKDGLVTNSDVLAIQRYFQGYTGGWPTGGLTSTKIRYGDVNNDFYVDENDVNAINKYIFNPTANPVDIEVADVNKDGLVTNSDILAINRFISDPELYPLWN